MFRLEDLTLFVRAAALNSFSDAAREVGVQPAQVSSAIKRLESTLAIRLFDAAIPRCACGFFSPTR